MHQSANCWRGYGGEKRASCGEQGRKVRSDDGRYLVVTAWTSCSPSGRTRGVLVRMKQKARLGLRVDGQLCEVTINGTLQRYNMSPPFWTKVHDDKKGVVSGGPR